MLLDQAPRAVQAWFAVETATDPEAVLRGALADDVMFDFGGVKIRGVDDVVDAIGFMMPPGWLGAVQWRMQDGGADGHIVIRGTGPGGALLPSPGGPMDYIDFIFALDTAGRIALVLPEPHQPEPPGLPDPLAPGAVAPAFRLPDVHGIMVPLRDADARATVVAFTCNHCPWALRWHDRLQAIVRDYAAQGVRVLQINPDDPSVHAEDAVEQSRMRVAQGAFAGPYLVDAAQGVARQWGVRLVSEVFVLDAHGVVAYHGALDADPSDPSQNAAWLRAALDAVLGGAKPQPARTKLSGCAVKWSR